VSAESPGEWPLTHEEVEEWCRSVEWRFAVTRPDNPHNYTLRRNTDPIEFQRIVLHIREFGYQQKWWGADYTMYRADGHHMWTMGAPLEATILINRKTDEQVREDERTGKGK
jgi:hypothetical protein